MFSSFTIEGNVYNFCPFIQNLVWNGLSRSSSSFGVVKSSCWTCFVTMEACEVDAHLIHFTYYG